ncbi:cupin domain-containing protein [Bacillota bacterium Meth-B3]|nr:cupin domain-containing protein [Christensenellaceae bacterium]
MCIPPCGEIGLEMHPDLDQFLRLEQGRGRVMMGSTQTSLNYQRDVSENFAIFIPAGTWHNLVNTGDEPIKLYSIYAPVQHPAGTIQCTKADSDAAG